MKSQFLLGALLGALPLCAQWLNYPAAGVPRLKDGSPDLSAPAPKTADGKPDLSGVWATIPTPAKELAATFGPEIFEFSVPGDDLRDFSKYFISILSDFKPGEEPLLPHAAKLYRERLQAMGADNPTSHCLPPGIPGSDMLLRKIVQTPGSLTVLYEAMTSFRQIYTDGRPLPVDPHPSWYGYSVAKWDGDTLVVESAGFNDRGWLDAAGTPRSEALRITERMHRRDFGHMDVEVTFTDPHTFTRPVTIRYEQVLAPDTDVLEYFCAENEKDRVHL